MIPRISLIISIFFLFLLIFPGGARAQNTKCPKPEVSITITHSQNGEKGSIKVEARNAESTFVLHLLAIGDHKEDRIKIAGGLIDNVIPGTYDLIIQATGKGFCSDVRKVTVN